MFHFHQLTTMIPSRRGRTPRPQPGMGDMVSLIESAVRVQQETEEAETAKRLAKSQLTLNDFIDMNRQIRKMGGVRKLVSALRTETVVIDAVSGAVIVMHTAIPED